MIFSRIYIQDCINLIRDKSRNIKQLLIMLNLKDKQALEAMWEVVISAELSKLGSIELEKDFSDYDTNSTPDIFFTNNNLTFLADIKCISDYSKHDENRVGELQSLIYKHFLKLGLSGFSVHIDIENIVIENKKGKSIDLKLPKNISTYFNTHIKNKLRRDQFYYEFEDLGDYKGLCFSMEIKLNNQFSSAHHASYTVSECDRKTTLYNTLNGSYEQIKFYDGFKGFIVCDGDYSLFKQKNYSGRRQYSTFESVCNVYLNQKSKVGFIIGIWVENKKGIYERGFDVRYKIYSLNALRQQELEELFGKIVENLPEVIRTPINAKNLQSSKNKYGTGSIGFQGQCNKTEITYCFSLREIQSILAGYKRFTVNEKHNMFPYISSGKLVCIWVTQEAYKEDYCFNIKCFEKPIIQVEKNIDDYDVLISVQSFFELMRGEVEYEYFEEKFTIENKQKINLFKQKYDNGYLIKNAGLIDLNNIGFKFDTTKSPLISDFV